MAQMLSMSVGTNAGTTTVLVSDEKTPKQILTENNISFGTAQVYLDSNLLDATKMNKTLAQLGVTSDGMLIAVMKQGLGNS